MKWKPLPGQVRQSAKNSLNQNLVIKSFWENCFEATLRTKANVLSVWKANFSVFYKFMSNKLETIFRESDAKRSKIFKLKFDHRKVLSVSVFYKFLSDKIETIFRESDAKRWKPFKLKFYLRKLIRKWFWIYLELKHECSERFKIAFFSFLQVFDWRNGNHFLESKVKSQKLIKSKFGHKKLLKKSF